MSSTDLQFPTGIAKGQTATANVTISPSPSIGPVTLKLETTSGTGSAVFASNGSNTLDIYESGAVQIRGVEASSTANNIRLSASTNGVQRASKEFSVVWVDLSMRAGSGITASQDDHARIIYQGIFGHLNLGAFDFFGDFGCRVGAELVGTVTPSNYSGLVVLRRDKLSYGVWDGSELRPGGTNPVTTPSPDNSNPNLRDDDPQSDGSDGKVYDLDAPGVLDMDLGHTWRYRANFSSFAVLDSEANSFRASEELRWYATLSCSFTEQGTALNNDISGDNQANIGTIPLSWNLQ